MMENKLKTEQPIVYQTLLNCINNNKLSHALLFEGEKGTPMLQAAIFLAQSLVCEHAVLACEKCESCIRIQDGHYSDFILLDGSKTSIKKEEILKLQDNFQKTALEKSGKKVYIINRAENATTAALNSLLKFLEEPQGLSTTAILIVEESKNILPTIYSRCQVLPFRSLTKTECVNRSIDLGVSKEDSLILSHFIKDVDAIIKVSEEESYQKAIVAVKYFLNCLRNLDQAMVFVDCEIFNDKNQNKETFIYFVDILIGLLHDVGINEKSNIIWYDQGIQDILDLNINISNWALILLETKDKCNLTFNLGLLINQCILNLKEELS